MDDSTQSICTECGCEEIERVSSDENDELICSECGYVIDSITPPVGFDEDSVDWKEKYQTQSENDGWDYWYPCPECGSNSLKQTQVAIVIATEDGTYGGEDDPDFDESIECAECGVVLK